MEALIVMLCVMLLRCGKISCVLVPKCRNLPILCSLVMRVYNVLCRNLFRLTFGFQTRDVSKMLFIVCYQSVL